MLSYLNGELAKKSPTDVVLDVGGVGYLVKISLYTFAKIEHADRAKLHVHYHVNQQDYTPSLYGFADEWERTIFIHLIDVKGVSVNSARVILSSMSPDEVRNAILSENEIAFRNVKGIGVKTAKQIILDLKDRMLKDGGQGEVDLNAPTVGGALREEALMALMALQFPRIPAQKALNKILKEHSKIDTVETLIKLAIKELR
jgi:Holliday junction DNA helicase RuvA